MIDSLMSSFHTGSLPTTLSLMGLLLLAAFLAALIDSVVGGGGIISLPALLAVGVPPHLALGTNKLAGTFSSFSSSISYMQRGKFHPAAAKHLFPLVLLSSVLGAWTALHISGNAIRIFILFMILTIGIYTLVKKQIGYDNLYTRYTIRLKLLGSGFGILIGFYDGFLGPGTGTFFLFVFMLLYRFDFVTAAGSGRILNFASNLGALVLFISTGQVLFLIGLPMGAAMLLGARLGVRLALKGGVKYIKPLFVTVCFLFVIKLGWDLSTGP